MSSEMMHLNAITWLMTLVHSQHQYSLVSFPDPPPGNETKYSYGPAKSLHSYNIDYVNVYVVYIIHVYIHWMCSYIGNNFRFAIIISVSKHGQP